MISSRSDFEVKFEILVTSDKISDKRFSKVDFLVSRLCSLITTDMSQVLFDESSVSYNFS